jgi:hypothetical protein
VPSLGTRHVIYATALINKTLYNNKPLGLQAIAFFSTAAQNDLDSRFDQLISALGIPAEAGMTFKSRATLYIKWLLREHK